MELSSDSEELLDQDDESWSERQSRAKAGAKTPFKKTLVVKPIEFKKKNYVSLSYST